MSRVVSSGYWAKGYAVDKHPANPLRVIFDNAFDSATVTSTTDIAAFPNANLKLDSKGSVWRSSTNTASITATWASPRNIGCIVLPYNNLTNAATLRVRIFTNIGDAATVYDSLTDKAVLGTLTDWSGSVPGVNTYNQGIGHAVTLWFTAISVTKVVIDIVDTSLTFIELSRVILGDHWAPVYNRAESGVVLNFNDTSAVTRTQNGNVNSSNGTINKSLDVPLGFLTVSDRNTLIQLLRIKGAKSPIFISVFPDSTNANEEQEFQVYGHVINSPTISNPQYTRYASNLSVEEV